MESSSAIRPESSFPAIEPVPTVELVPTAQPVPMVELVPERPQAPSAEPRKPAYSWRRQGWIPFFIGWIWRITLGISLCLSALPSVAMSFLGSIVVFGWLYRWMQARTLHYWWKQSRRRSEIAFHEFCDELDPDGPVGRPRWFWHERPIQLLNRPAPSGTVAGPFRTLARLFLIPTHSFLLNIGRGIQGLLATYLV